MENIVAKKSASISDYHDIFIHWISWFHVNEAMYDNLINESIEHINVGCDKKYNEFLNYKGRCLTSISSNYAECAFMTAERIHKVLSKEVEGCESAASLCSQDKTEAKPMIEECSSATKVYLNGDTCQSFYRSGAVELFLANCSEENFYQLMNLNSPTPKTGIKLIYADGLYYVLRILKDFLIDKEQTQDWINGVLKYFGKNYKTFEAHSNDVFTDSENEKSGAYKLYPIVKNWLKSRKEA